MQDNASDRLQLLSEVLRNGMAFVVVKLKVFKVFDSASMKWPLFGGFLRDLFPQILFNLAEILTKGSLRPIKRTQCFKTPSNFRILA